MKKGVLHVRTLDPNSVPTLYLSILLALRLDVVGNSNPKEVLYLRLDPTRERLGATLRPTSFLAVIMVQFPRYFFRR